MGRRVLLVDDEVAVLLTLKAVLEISGFEVDTAASAREGRSKLHTREYQMVITDMRMESDAAGAEVIEAARQAANHPAVALLTAFPVAEEDWQEMGADKLLVKPVHTRILIEQIENLLTIHEAKLAKLGGVTAAAAKTPVKSGAKKAAPARKTAVKKAAPKKAATKKAMAGRVSKGSTAKKAVKKKAIKKKAIKAVATKTAAKKASKKSPAKKRSVSKKRSGSR